MARTLQRIILLATCVAAAVPAHARATGTITWKPVENAILRITGQKPSKQWNVYQDQKNKVRVLLQIDSRWLVLNAKTKEAFEISSSQIQTRGKKLQSPDPSASQRALPSADWDMRDIGLAERIETRLTGDNISIVVELPHPLELRSPY